MYFNKTEIETRLTEILQSYVETLQFEFDEEPKMSSINTSAFYEFSAGIVNNTSLRLVNYLQRHAGFLIDLLFLCHYVERLNTDVEINSEGQGGSSETDPDNNVNNDSGQADVQQNDFKNLYENLKTNCQIYLACESVCQSLLTNKYKISEYQVTQGLNQRVINSREIYVSTDLIATFYNSFDYQYCNEGGLEKFSNPNIVNNIVEFVFKIIKGHIPDQDPNFLQKIS